jgi:hypothetical protein
MLQSEVDRQTLEVLLTVTGVHLLDMISAAFKILEVLQLGTILVTVLEEDMTVIQV